MKIILELATETPEERREVHEYAAALARHAERSRWNGRPGLLLEMADSSVWVAGVILVEDTSEAS